MLVLIYAIVILVISSEANFLEKLEKPEVREIKARLEDEKAKRLLLQNDVEMLMLKVEQLQRNCKKGQTTVATPTDTKTIQDKISFSARLSAQITLDTYHVILFDQVLHNHGNGYSTSTGIFRPPLAGTYVFSLSLLSAGKGLRVHAQIMKNTTEIGRLFAGSDVAAWPDQGSVTVVASLAESDEVFVREFSTSGTIHGDFYCSFTGFQI